MVIANHNKNCKRTFQKFPYRNGELKNLRELNLKVESLNKNLPNDLNIEIYHPAPDLSKKDLTNLAIRLLEKNQALVSSIMPYENKTQLNTSKKNLSFIQSLTIQNKLGRIQSPHFSVVTRKPSDYREYIVRHGFLNAFEVAGTHIDDPKDKKREFRLSLKKLG